MSTRIAHVALFDTVADWEVGHLLAELRTGRFTGTPFEVVTVAESRDPVTTMGGLRMLPDMLLSDLDPADSDLLILPGAEVWDAGGGAAFAAAARRFLDAGVPVAAICGATAGLARAGLLDGRAHTSADPRYLAATGYAGGEHYVDDRAVVDGDLITAGPDAPVQFACARRSALGLASRTRLEAYEAVFDRGDATGSGVLMQAEARMSALRRGGVAGPAADDGRGRPSCSPKSCSPRSGSTRPALEVAQGLAAAGGLTAAWWQVLGGVIDEPRTVAESAGGWEVTRQGVQRVADLLVHRGWRSTAPIRPIAAPSCSPAPRPATGRFAGSRSSRAPGPRRSARSSGRPNCARRWRRCGA